jgi:hypothetical protein
MGRGSTRKDPVGQQSAQLRGEPGTLGADLEQPAVDPVQQFVLAMLAELHFHLAPRPGRRLLTHGLCGQVVIGQ